ncbi:copper resistance protein CopC [Microbacterium sp. NPDC090003]|uniref:copper resistance CopC family protein n=1 Tax=Microbacterium sp. NPDC090003 TaxID=3364203 RepID=UPI003809567A
MQTTILRRSTAPLALAATLLTAFLVLFAPLSASAHDDLISSSPAADSTVDVLPSEIVLTFNADLITGENATEVQVLDANENLVSEGAAVTEGATVTQPLMAAAEAGVYRVVWKVVSSDGHPTSEEFSFTVANSTDPTPTPTATETASAPFASAEPSASPSASPTTTATDDDASASPSTAWIWILVVLGILVIAAGITLAVILSRRRRGASPTGSDGSTSR